ncbi:unnamed protein product [Spirodela intermedia]|uniref:Uncharacterized protein n=1 Tax=Spirodela intermedia TaxID=51605 RepID=A0A7I8JNM1_SPIIN|nr:unnamed protein product [Spirodela intermedia]CAA6671375.1 unnamed protein product [Spirodela intermedia]
MTWVAQMARMLWACTRPGLPSPPSLKIWDPALNHTASPNLTPLRAMDDLQLTVLGEGLGVGGEAGGVPAEGASPEKGPRYLTRSGPYQGLPEETGLGLAAVFLMEILPSPRTSEAAGASLTAFPAREGEERAMAQALLLTGSARWSARFSSGPFPVTMACTKKPNMENMASLPFFNSFTFSSAKASGSSARPSGSKLPPGYSGSNDLGGPDGQDALGVHQAGVTQVVQAALAEDLGPGLEPHGLAELDAVAGEQLREDAAQGAEHGPAGGVPAVVAGELAGEEGASPEKGPRYLTRSGPYQGLPEETGLGLAAAFLMEILPSPRTSEAAGASLTAFPAREGEERAMVAAIVMVKASSVARARMSSGVRDEEIAA